MTVIWKERAKGNYHWVSDKPRGYYITRVPYNDLCHMVCMHEREEGSPEHIGSVNNIWKNDIETQRVALADLKKMCDEHATKRLG